MRSAIYFSLGLTLWPLFISSLPLQSCLHHEPLPQDDVISCTPIEPWTHDLPLDGDLPHRKPRATEELAKTDTVSALESRGALVKHAAIKAEKMLRRNVESLFFNVGKEGHIVDSRAGRTLKERWGIYHGNFASINDTITDSTGSTSRKRWTISLPGSRWNVPEASGVGSANSTGSTSRKRWTNFPPGSQRDKATNNIPEVNSTTPPSR